MTKNVYYGGMEEPAVQSSYTVKTSSFEGPLGLLLDLVEGKKLFINEISLARVTDDFLAYARSLPKNDLSELTSFLSIASTLILIKSRSLLPGFLVTKEEESEIQDLELRLALYQIIREISTELSEKYGTKKIILPPERELVMSVFAPDPKLSIDLLATSAQECLGRIPKETILPEVRIRKVISIDEMLSRLTERVASATKFSFREWQNSVPGEDKESKKGNVIVSFLAMLELVRQGMMDALQNIEFDDIELSTINKQQEEQVQ